MKKPIALTLALAVTTAFLPMASAGAQAASNGGAPTPAPVVGAAGGVPLINWTPQVSEVAISPGFGGRLQNPSTWAGDPIGSSGALGTGVSAFIDVPLGGGVSYRGLNGTRLDTGPYGNFLFDRGAVSPQYAFYEDQRGANAGFSTVAPFPFAAYSAAACAGVLSGGYGSPEHPFCVANGGPPSSAYNFWYSVQPDPVDGANRPRWRFADDGGWHIFAPGQANVSWGPFGGFETGTLPKYDYAWWHGGVTLTQVRLATWWGDAGAPPPPGGTATPPVDVDGACDPSPTGTLGAAPSMLVRTAVSPSTSLAYPLPAPTLDPVAAGYSISWGSLTATVVDGSDYGGSATTAGTTLNYQPALWRRMTSAVGPTGREGLMIADTDDLIVRWDGTINVTDGVQTTTTAFSDLQNIGVAVCPRLPTPDPTQTMPVPGVATEHAILHLPNDDQVWDDGSLLVQLQAQPTPSWRIGRYESPDNTAGSGTVRGPNAAEVPAGVNLTGRFRFLPGRTVSSGSLTINFTARNNDNKVAGGVVQINIVNSSESPT